MNSTDTIGVQQVNMADSAPDDGLPPSWLQSARWVQSWYSPSSAWSTALEVALADMAGHPCGDGLFPWAAHHATQLQLQGTHWAQLNLCHWHVSNGQVTLLPPRWPEPHLLQALWSEMAAFVAADGLHLTPTANGQALVCGDSLRDLPTASWHKVLGRPVGEFLPDSQRLRRLQNELQMWLYTHPSLQNQPRPINSVWFCGTGTLSAQLKHLLDGVRWSHGSDVQPGQQQVLASDTQASLWRIDAASWGQRLWRRFKPLPWPIHDHELD